MHPCTLQASHLPNVDSQDRHHEKSLDTRNSVPILPTPHRGVIEQGPDEVFEPQWLAPPRRGEGGTTTDSRCLDRRWLAGLRGVQCTTSIGQLHNGDETTQSFNADYTGRMEQIGLGESNRVGYRVNSASNHLQNCHFTRYGSFRSRLWTKASYYYPSPHPACP